MRKFIFLKILFLSFNFLMAQAPLEFPFQGIGTDLSGNPITNTQISIQISIISGNTTGNIEYIEKHTPITTSNGIFTVNIGGGIIQSGSFIDINWASKPHFVKIEVDENAGNNYHDLGTIQLLSVPYALHANSSIKTSSSIIDVTEEGAIANRITDNTILIQNIIDRLDPNLGGEILIPKNVKYDFPSLINLPIDYIIHDNSTWDWKYGKWTAQIKSIIATGDPGTKNANEQIIMAPHHPALIIDNTDDSRENRASLILRSKGQGSWRVGMGRLDNDKDFLIASMPGLKTRLNISNQDGNFGFNEAPQNGISYVFGNSLDNDTNFKFLSNSSKMTQFLFQTKNGNVFSRLKFINDGSIILSQNGAPRITFGSNHSIFGYKNEIENKTNTTNLDDRDNHKIFTNEGSTGGFIFNLPSALKGYTYRFVVVVENNMRITPISNNNIRGLGNGKHTESNEVGASIELYCVVDGVWEIGLKQGNWIDQK